MVPKTATTIGEYQKFAEGRISCLVVVMSATKCDENCATKFMQPICMLHNFVFSDIIPHQNISKSCLFIDLTSQAPLSHA